MNLLNDKRLLAVLCAFGLATSFSWSDTTDTLTTLSAASAKEKNAEFNTRPLAIEIQEKVAADRAQEEECGEDQAKAVSCSARLIPSDEKTTFFPGAVNVVADPIYEMVDKHIIQAFPQANIIQLEDGSEWTIPKSQEHKLRLWGVGQTILITPNRSFFASGSYYLTNLDRGKSYVEVEPTLGPLFQGPYTHWIVGINYQTGKVSLINGLGNRTTWKINSSDLYLIKEWKTNEDMMIVASNDSYFSCLNGYRYALINVPMNHYVRAKPF